MRAMSERPAFRLPWRPLLAAALAVPLAMTAAAAPVVRTEAPVVRVNLDVAGAVLVREVALEFAADTRQLVVTGLPADLDVTQLEVALTPQEAGQLLAIAARTVPLAQAAAARERELEGRIEELRSRLQVHRDRIEAGRIQLELVRRIGGSAAELASRQLVEGEIAPEAWRRAWEALGTGALDILTLIREQEQAARTLEREIERLERELEGLRTGRREVRELVLDLAAVRPGRARLVLVHRSPEARADPRLVARLDSTTGRLALVRRVRLTQRTGEDWQQVMLAITTADPSRPPAPPRPDPLWVDVTTPPPPPPAPAPTGVAERALLPPFDLAPPAMARPAVTRRPFDADFTLPQPVDVPGDGREVLLTLDRQLVEARVGLEVVPALDPRPRVVARATYEGGVALPPGRVRLVRDGVPVGEADFPGVEPGGELVLGFGVDPRVRVERRVVGDRRGEAGFFGGRKRLRRSWQILVHNGHERPVRLTVVERLPVPQDERIEVALDEATTPPDRREVDGVLGTLAWDLTLKPGERRKLRFGYEVSWPEELELVGLE